MDTGTLVSLLGEGLLQTLYMTVLGTLMSYVIGLPIGVSLIVTGPNGIRPVAIYNKVMGFIVNVIRSVPFLILMIALMPYIRKVIGTGIGTSATTAALVVAAAPFVARLVEQSLLEVDPGVIEAAQAMGAGNFQIIRKVLLLEARPSLLNGAAVATINILGYSAMAGIVGGGGLGDLAIRYGLYRFQPSIMWITIIVLVILVQILQEAGIRIAAKMDNRISEVHPALIRDKEFTPFPFIINDRGLPEKVDGLDLRHRPKKKLDYRSIPEEKHRKALDIVFGITEKNKTPIPIIKATELIERFMEAYKTVGYDRRKNCHYNLRQFLLDRQVIEQTSLGFVYNRDFHLDETE